MKNMTVKSHHWNWRSIFSLFFLLLLFSGCGQVKTINLQRHQFSKAPTQIVWLQIAGLRPEHFSMIRFAESSTQRVMSMENATCVANLWNYSLYDLRPTAAQSFHSQIYGTKNVVGDCRDYHRVTPFWEGLSSHQYHVAILENTQYFSWWQNRSECAGQDDGLLNRHYKKTSFFKARLPQNEDAQLFHYQDPRELKVGKNYYDRSCGSDGCFSRLSDNARFLWNNFSADYQRKILIIQDDSYLRAIQAEDFHLAQEILHEIEKTYSFFSRIQHSRSDFLLILSSAESQGIEMPRDASEWTQFFSGTGRLAYRTSHLDSMLFAQGARAENLCGFYQQAQVAHRIRWQYQSQGFFSRE